MRPPLRSGRSRDRRPARAASEAASPNRLHLRANLYVAQTQPGFESVSWSEISARAPEARLAGFRSVPDRAGIAIFSMLRLPAFGKIRTAEDLFALAGYWSGIGDDRAALEAIAATARSAPYVDQALAARVAITPGSRAGRRLTFRVVARTSGRHEFRRIDFQRAIERGISERGDRRFRLAGDDAEVEFWATLLGDELLLAVRLSDERMRHREYKVAQRPASLRPAAAAALAWLSEPRDDDVVLDPMCGAGTILIERAHLGRYKMLIGADRDPEALDAARVNVGPRYKPIDLKPWDAGALALGDHSVTKIVTNLPWGLRSGSHEENRRLYPRLVREFNRVLGPDRIMVLLTAETAIMRNLLMRGELRAARILNVAILGAPAAVYVCRS